MTKPVAARSVSSTRPPEATAPKSASTSAPATQASVSSTADHFTAPAAHRSSSHARNTAVPTAKIDPISGEKLPHYGTVDEPALMDAQATDSTSSYQLEDANGPLFNGRANPNDIHQGQAGDCYFLSSLAAIANSEPQSFKHLIYDNHDGTFTVTFHAWDDKTQSFKAQVVKVDPKFYVTHPNTNASVALPTYDAGQQAQWGPDDPNTTSLWGQLLEKAYAQWKGGSYEVIGQGGWPAQAMEDLLGRRSQGVTTSDTPPDKVWGFIQSAVDTHSPICAATSCDPDQQAKYTNTGLIAEHAYTVMGAEVKDGQRYVKLRNPWGETEPSGNGPDDGVFELPFADFLKFYDTVQSCPRH